MQMPRNRVNQITVKFSRRATQPCTTSRMRGGSERARPWGGSMTLGSLDGTTINLPSELPTNPCFPTIVEVAPVAMSTLLITWFCESATYTTPPLTLTPVGLLNRATVASPSWYPAVPMQVPPRLQSPSVEHLVPVLGRSHKHPAVVDPAWVHEGTEVPKWQRTVGVPAARS